MQIDEIKDLAAQFGLSIIGVSAPTVDATDRRALALWQEGGMAGEMQYMRRETLGDINAHFPHVQGVLSVAIQYSSAPRGLQPHTSGKVARYAWGKDYHFILPELLRQFAIELSRYASNPEPVQVVTDAVPLLERALARKAGLGFVGKNTLIIRPGLGSLFFLAELLLPFPVSGSLVAKSGGCGSCTRCQTACPTGAFVKPFTLDARRCISYLSIEKRGVLETAECAALGDWIFGCDICQEVCPFNWRALREGAKPLVQAFDAAQGVGPYLDIPSVLAIRTNGEFEARFGGTALMRTRRAGLLRNAAIVAANRKMEQAVPALRECVARDPSPVVRHHAGVALQQLSGKENLDQTKPIESAC